MNFENNKLSIGEITWSNIPSRHELQVIAIGKSLWAYGDAVAIGGGVFPRYFLYHHRHYTVV